MDSVVRDIQNTQCLLNVEHLSAGCPHVTLQFADSKGDVGLGLVKEGLVMVEVRKEKQFQKVVRDAEVGPHARSRRHGAGLGTASGASEGAGKPPSCCSCWGKIMGFSLLGFLFLKKKLITSQINWLQVWLRMQLQTRAESFPLHAPPGDRLEALPAVAWTGSKPVWLSVPFSLPSLYYTTSKSIPSS